MTHEEWRDVVGYEGIYQVSNLGNVRSLDRIDCANPPRHRKGSVLKQRKCPNGYLKVTLYKDKTPKQINVHRLVIETFVGASNLQVNHKNEDKSDNRLSNLEYMTGRDNTRYSCCKPVESYDLRTGKAIKKYDGMVDAERDGHDGGAISNVCLRKKGFLSHHGMGWRFQSQEDA